MNTGGSAFPWQIDDGEKIRGHKGMDLRDYFAAKAMAAFMNSKTAVQLDSAGYTATALIAYNMADAMLKRREK